MTRSNGVKKNMQRTQYLLARNGTFVGLVGLIIYFTLTNERFLSLSNAEVIGLQAAAIGVIAIPMALLVISGSVDLSVGSVLSMAAIICAAATKSSGPVIGLLAALGFGAVAGAINGYLVSYLRFNAIVITLGFEAAWGGFALYCTNGQAIAGLPHSFTKFGTETLLGIPLQIYALAVACLIGWWILNRRPIGRHVYAVGGNERAAFLMGVRVSRVRFKMFVYTGMAAAFAAVLLVNRLQAAPPTVGVGMELNVLTVVLLGGVGFAGGTGRISGVIAGLLLVGVLKDGLVITGTSQFLQQVFIGLTLVIAVALDDTLQKLARRTWISEDERMPDDDDGGGGSPPGPEPNGRPANAATAAPSV
jgi:ribose/xylose/arabinose/galactoside ABC-type transport system permease subunit